MCWDAHVLQEDIAHCNGGSLLSTINSHILDSKIDAKHGLPANEFVTRELAQALARSIATISRNTSREISRDGSPEKSRASSPKKGRQNSSHFSLGDCEGGCEGASEHDQDVERCEALVKGLQEQTKRRMRELDRLHSDADKKPGPTLYNPGAYQVHTHMFIVNERSTQSRRSDFIQLHLMFCLILTADIISHVCSIACTLVFCARTHISHEAQHSQPR